MLLAAILIPSTQVGFLFLLVWFSENRVVQFGQGFFAWYIVNVVAWNLFFMPVMMALMATLCWEQEKQARAWDIILIQPIYPVFHYLVKVISLLGALLLSVMILGGLLIICGLLFRIYVPELSMGSIRVEILFYFLMFSTLSSLPLMGFHAWLASRNSNLLASMIVGLAGMWIAFQGAGQGPLIALWPWGMAAQVADVALRAKHLSWGFYGCSLIATSIFIGVGLFEFGWRTQRRNFGKT